MNRRTYLKTTSTAITAPFGLNTLTSLASAEDKPRFPKTIQGVPRTDIRTDLPFSLEREAVYGEGRVLIDEFSQPPNDWANSCYSVRVDCIVHYPETLFEGIRLATSHLARVDAEVHHTDNYTHRFYQGRNRDWKVHSTNTENPFVAYHNDERHEFSEPWERTRFIANTVRDHISTR